MKRPEANERGLSGLVSNKNLDASSFSAFTLSKLEPSFFAKTPAPES